MFAIFIEANDCVSRMGKYSIFWLEVLVEAQNSTSSYSC